MMKEQELYPLLNSKKWTPESFGWTIIIDDILIEAREDRNRWQARTKNSSGYFSRWSPFVSTRWQAGLMAYNASFEMQSELDLGDQSSGTLSD